MTGRGSLTRPARLPGDATVISIDDVKANPVTSCAVGVGVLAVALFLFLHGEVLRANAVEAQGPTVQLLSETEVDESPKAVTERSAAAPSRRDNAYDGGVGFVVPFRPDCPAGAEREGAIPPDGFKEWCEKTGRERGIKHGWHATFYPNGRPESAGEYRDGLRVGVWTRWYESGAKRVQAEFKEGLQHGRLISWNERGVRLGEQHYADGDLIGKRN
jgi:hypothetical protein